MLILFRFSLMHIGRAFLGLSLHIGKFVTFLLRTIESLRPPFYHKEFGKQIINIGYYSISLIGMTALFTGAALAMQSYNGFSSHHTKSSVPIVIALSIVRELIPVLCGLMIAGRVGAGISSELANMKSTEQIDALYIMDTNPLKYLVLPRVIAGILCSPILTIIADTIGIMGGYVVAVCKFDVQPQHYIQTVFTSLSIADILAGIIKSALFSFFVCMIGCYNGLTSKGGAYGVGESVTKTVMHSSMVILILNYIMTGIMINIL